MLKQDYLRNGAAIYERSFAIIRAEADLSRFTPEEAEVAVRMIHAAGQVEVAGLIEFAPEFVSAARKALRGGAPILCDSEMVAHGVTRARLPAKSEVICTLGDPRVPDLAAKLGTTRSAAALELWRDKLAGAVIAIGNAPTALFRLLEVLEAGAAKPAAIIGIPVGFVGAAESKEALAANVSGVPYLMGRLIGVGVGPGDPGLLTLNAIAALNAADVIAHFAKAGNASNARTIAAKHLKPGVEELSLLYPLTTEISKEDAAYRETLREFYDSAAAQIAGHLDQDRTVAVIAEGDPLFYGSYMHLHVRLAPRYPTEVVAGVTGMSGCWSAIGEPIAQGDDVFTVLPGTLPEYELERRLADADAAVVMKIGRHLAKVRRALDRAGRLERAIYVERGTMTNAAVMPLVDKLDTYAPYFAIVLVPGWEARP
jgi:precorrin-2/cobalt-factor-2 C20-methyltransferase